MGVLTTDNDKDFYGIEITSPGLYNFSIESQGETPVVAYFRFYEGGLPFSGGSSVTSNGSRIIEIRPDQLGEQYTYQIALYGELWWEAIFPAAYVMRFDLLSQIDSAIIGRPLSCDFHQTGDQKWFLLRTGISGILPTMQAYEFRIEMNVTRTVQWSFYEKNGLLQSFGASTSNQTNVVLLEAPEYYFCLASSSAVGMSATAYFELTELEILRPSQPIEVQMLQAAESQRRRFYQISLQEGVHYAISATCESTLDVSFRIHKGPASGLTSLDFSEWGYGEEENVTDLVFWGQYSLYSDWNDESTRRSRPVLGTSWNGDLIDHSKLVLELVAIAGNGDVTVTISEGEESPRITASESIRKLLDNDIGPYWHLLKLTNLEGLVVYNITVEHHQSYPTGLGTSYDFFGSRGSEQQYLYYQRPWLDGRGRAYVERGQSYEFSVDWETYGLGETQSHLVYQSIPGDRWLLIRVPDIEEAGEIPYRRLLSGEVEISVRAETYYNATLDVTQGIECIENQPVALRVRLEGGHTYRIELAAINGSSYAECNLYNESGFRLTGQFESSWLYIPWQANEDVRYKVYYIVSSGMHAFLVYGNGESPVSVTITELGQPGNVDVTFTLIGIMGAAAGGIVLGVLIGKTKFKAGT
ncbi:MAG: hypothetical protein EAX95_05315 [Candidatus Thorarchaeota archaeon]|nr:hypothetical protein [Candidatus Thorarchaeota archaeon]